MTRLERPVWDREVARLLAAQYGCEPTGPDVPAMLEDAYQRGVRPGRMVSDLADRFGLELLPSRRPGGIKP